MNLSVLLISTDPAMTDMLAGVLFSLHFDVTAVVGTEAALQSITARPPHIVVLDLPGPPVDGRDTCRAIRLTNNVPIVVLSALDDPSIVARLLDAGADDYLVKPVPVSVLIAHLRKLASRTGALGLDQPEPAEWLPDPQPQIR